MDKHRKPPSAPFSLVETLNVEARLALDLFRLPHFVSTTRINLVDSIKFFPERGADIWRRAPTTHAQPTPEHKPDISNKALITKATPSLSAQTTVGTAQLHKLADDYYTWRNENFPVTSSEFGLHTWDDRLTDYAPAKIAEREKHVRTLLEKVRAMKTETWPKDDRIDWILFRSQLEQFDFARRVLQPTEKNPQIYVGECVSGIFRS